MVILSFVYFSLFSFSLLLVFVLIPNIVDTTFNVF